jgi:hypothetical protein
VPPTKAQVRKTLESALSKFNNLTEAGYRCGVSEGAIRHWKRRGHVNGVPVETVLRLSRATGIPVEDFVIDDE